MAKSFHFPFHHSSLPGNSGLVPCKRYQVSIPFREAVQAPVLQIRVGSLRVSDDSVRTNKIYVNELEIQRFRATFELKYGHESLFW
jgi:hypothetical protein